MDSIFSSIHAENDISKVAIGLSVSYIRSEAPLTHSAIGGAEYWIGQLINVLDTNHDSIGIDGHS